MPVTSPGRCLRQDSRLDELLHRCVGGRLAHAQFAGDNRDGHDRLTKQQVLEAVHRGITTCSNGEVPPCDELSDVPLEQSPVGDGGEGSVRQGLDDGTHIAISVIGQSTKVSLGVTQQPCRDRHRHVLGDTTCAQHSLHERTSGAAIAVGEWVDRFELRVCDRHLRDHRQVGATRESHDVIHQVRHAVLMRGDERGVVRGDGTSPDPHLLIPPATHDSGARLLQQCPMHRQDRLWVQVVRKRYRGLHRRDVADHELRVASRRGTDLCECHLLRARCQILYLGT